MTHLVEEDLELGYLGVALARRPQVGLALFGTRIWGGWVGGWREWRELGPWRWGLHTHCYERRLVIVQSHRDEGEGGKEARRPMLVKTLHEHPY